MTQKENNLTVSEFFFPFLTNRINQECICVPFLNIYISNISIRFTVLTFQIKGQGSVLFSI